jgi:hypothetical protein
MSMELTLGLTHAALALITAATAAGVVRDLRRRQPDSAAGRWLVVALGAVTAWSAHLSWYWLLGPSSAQALWLPAVGATFAAILAWSVALLRPAAAGARLWVLALLADPVLLLAAHLVLGPESVVERTGSTIAYGPVYPVHALLCLGALVGAASLWAGCRHDPSRTVRLLAVVVVTGLLAAGVLEVLQLRLMNVAVSVTLVVVAAVLLRAEPSSLRARPEAGALLDDPDALVLVFDRDDVLVDLNSAAHAFLADPDGASAVGATAERLLPIPLARAADGADLRLDGPDGAVDLVCFAARLSASTSPPGGSIVVLRPRRTGAAAPSLVDSADATSATAATTADTSDTDREPGSDFQGQLDQLAADADTLVGLGVRFECQEDAARAAHAVTFVVGSLGALTIRPVDDRSWLAVAPAHLEPILVDVASDWQSRTAPAEPREDGGPLAVSLAPVLAGDLVVRRGPAAQASSLVASVRDALTSAR